MPEYIEDLSMIDNSDCKIISMMHTMDGAWHLNTGHLDDTLSYDESKTDIGNADYENNHG